MLVINFVEGAWLYVYFALYMMRLESKTELTVVALVLDFSVVLGVILELTSSFCKPQRLGF